jgi:hypothetical protein
MENLANASVQPALSCTAVPLLPVSGIHVGLRLVGAVQRVSYGSKTKIPAKQGQWLCLPAG